MSHRVENTDEAAFRARLEAVLSDHYELGSEIGRGGMGIVYRATDRRLKRQVAIKLLPPELAFRFEIKSRFLREAVSAAQLSHPNIVPIFSVDERDGLVFFAMGFVDGDNLGNIVSMSGRLPADEVRRVLREVADALAYAHEHGVVHRDIKPDNIILDSSTRRAMVTDFGIARALTDSGDTRLTATGVAIGTPAYMSPEQCAGDREIDGRSDLYSLGVVGYQMLCGVPPFEASTTPALLIKHFSEVPEHIRARRNDVPADLAAIVMRLLEKKPEERFATGRELADALDGKVEVNNGVRKNQPPASSSRPKPAGSDRAGSRVAAADDASSRDGLAAQGGRYARRRHNRVKFHERPLAERVKITRAEAFRVLGMSAFFFFINMVTWAGFPWFVFPALGMGMGLWGKLSSLMADGVRWADIFGKNAHRVMAGDPAAGQATPALLGQIDAAERFAPREVLDSAFGPLVRQAIADFESVRAQMDRLSNAEKGMLPDVMPTAKALFDRVILLGGTLNALDSDVDAAKIRRIEERIAAAEAESGTGHGLERKLALLRKQRSSLHDLLESRDAMRGQFENAAIMLQNLSLDVLKLRSAGIQSVMHEVNSATQEARALVKEIGFVLDAADELRAMESQSSGEK